MRPNYLKMVSSDPGLMHPIGRSIGACVVFGPEFIDPLPATTSLPAR
jgi:hypothetical protein